MYAHSQRARSCNLFRRRWFYERRQRVKEIVSARRERDAYYEAAPSITQQSRLQSGETGKSGEADARGNEMHTTRGGSVVARRPRLPVMAVARGPGPPRRGICLTRAAKQT